MSLVQCKECGTEISSTAEVCPKCGKRRKSNRAMWIIVVAVVLVAALWIGKEVYDRHRAANWDEGRLPL